MKIEEYDSWIVQVGEVYLVGMPYERTGMCRLSNSRYEALRFDDAAVASRIAHMAGGRAVRFNPISGRVGE